MICIFLHFHIELGKRLTRQTNLPDQLINYIGESWQSDISHERAKDIFVQVILHLQKYDDEVSDIKIGILLFYTIAVDLDYIIHVTMSYWQLHCTINFTLTSK